jgi:hypothetical protein
VVPVPPVPLVPVVPLVPLVPLVLPVPLVPLVPLAPLSLPRRVSVLVPEPEVPVLPLVPELPLLLSGPWSFLLLRCLPLDLCLVAGWLGLAAGWSADCGVFAVFWPLVELVEPVD